MLIVARVLQGAAGAELFGGGLSELMRRAAIGGFAEDVGDGFAVRGGGHRVQVPLAVDGVTISAEWQVAAAPQRGQYGALRRRGEGGFGVVEAAYGFEHDAARQVADAVVGGVRPLQAQGFEGERALAGRGADLIDGKALVDVLGAAEAV